MKKISEKKVRNIFLRQGMPKFVSIFLVTVLVIFFATVMAFYYEEIGHVLVPVSIIASVILLLPKFLRKNFNTHKKTDVEIVAAPDYQSKIGSFIWTRAEDNGLFPYREFRSFSKSSKKQLDAKVFYIDLKAKCLIVIMQLVHMALVPFGFAFCSSLEDALSSIVAIVIFVILVIISYDETRNFIIRKSAKNTFITNQKVN